VGKENHRGQNLSLPTIFDPTKFGRFYFRSFSYSGPTRMHLLDSEMIQQRCRPSHKIKCEDSREIGGKKLFKWSLSLKFETLRVL